jgi:hypothetical protein
LRYAHSEEHTEEHGQQEKEKVFGRRRHGDEETKRPLRFTTEFTTFKQGINSLQAAWMRFVR